MREGVAAASGAHGYTLKYDVSLGAESYYELVKATRVFIKQSDSFTVEEKDTI